MQTVAEPWHPAVAKPQQDIGTHRRTDDDKRAMLQERKGQAGKEAVAAKMDLKAAMAHTRKSMDPVFGHVFIYEHCLPFDVSRAYDEASGIKNPRIWTAERDKEMWAALQN